MEGVQQSIPGVHAVGPHSYLQALQRSRDLRSDLAPRPLSECLSHLPAAYHIAQTVILSR